VAGASPGTPLGSLEVRWMMAGPLSPAVRGWFARFPAEAETRQDAYLMRPRLPGLSVKLRGGRALEVKSYLGSPGILDGPARGRLESWRKWSFPYDPDETAGELSAGWVTVRKTRHTAWFPVADGPDPRAVTGCTVELAEAERAGSGPRGGPWWPVGFEATGSPGLLDHALRQAAGLVFARPLPDGIRLTLDDSASYALWLGQRSGA